MTTTDAEQLREEVRARYAEAATKVATGSRRQLWRRLLLQRAHARSTIR